MNDGRRPEATSGSTLTWVAGCVLAAAGILVLFVGITGFTGLPGPEPIRRYPTAELQRVVDEINQQLAEGGSSVPGAPASASVDVIRGRVRIEGTLPCMGFDRAEDWEMILPGYDRIDCGDAI
jgi:hypothetical protein